MPTSTKFQCQRPLIQGRRNHIRLQGPAAPCKATKLVAELIAATCSGGYAPGARTDCGVCARRWARSVVRYCSCRSSFQWCRLHLCRCSRTPTSPKRQCYHILSLPPGFHHYPAQNDEGFKPPHIMLNTAKSFFGSESPRLVPLNRRCEMVRLS